MAETINARQLSVEAFPPEIKACNDRDQLYILLTPRVRALSRLRLFRRWADNAASRGTAVRSLGLMDMGGRIGNMRGFTVRAVTV